MARGPQEALFRPVRASLSPGTLPSPLRRSSSADACRHGIAEVIREKGLDEITLEGLVDEITPHARGPAVPSSAKQAALCICHCVAPFLCDVPFLCVACP